MIKPNRATAFAIAIFVTISACMPVFAGDYRSHVPTIADYQHVVDRLNAEFDTDILTFVSPVDKAGLNAALAIPLDKFESDNREFIQYVLKLNAETDAAVAKQESIGNKRIWFDLVEQVDGSLLGTPRDPAPQTTPENLVGGQALRSTTPFSMASRLRA